MMVRRKSEDGELLHVVIIRRPTPIASVSATTRRRVVFAAMPTGLAVLATSDMTSSIPVQACLRALLVSQSGTDNRCGAVLERARAIEESQPIARYRRRPLAAAADEDGRRAAPKL